MTSGLGRPRSDHHCQKPGATGHRFFLLLLSHILYQEISVLKSRKGKPETHCYWKTSLNHKEQTWPLGLILLGPLGSCFGVSRFMSFVKDPEVQVIIYKPLLSSSPSLPVEQRCC